MYKSSYFERNSIEKDGMIMYCLIFASIASIVGTYDIEGFFFEDQIFYFSVLP